MTIYDNIRKRREQLNMTQQELAERMGYTSRSTISKIENGENDIPQSKIIAFAKALHTTPAYLMGWENEQKETPPPVDGGMDEILACLKSAPDAKGCDDANVVRIAGRDGTFMEKRLTDDQIELLKKLIDQMKDFDGDL